METKRTQNVDMLSAFKLFWTRYLDFKGRSTRPEFWWWFLWYALITVVMMMIDNQALIDVWSLVTVVPMATLAIRRIRDAGMPNEWAMTTGTVRMVGDFVSLVAGVAHLLPLLIASYIVALIAGLVIVIYAFLPTKHQSSKKNVKEK